MTNFSNPNFNTNLSSWKAGKIANEIAGLYFWHDATQMSANDGDSLGQIDDESGSDYHVTQSTSTVKPTYKNNETDNINSLPCFYFDGGDRMTSSETTPLTDDWTMFEVGVVGSSGNWKTFLGFGTEGASGNALFSYGPTPYLHFNPAWSGGWDTSNAANTTDSHVSLTYRTGTTISGSVNAQTEATGSYSLTYRNGHILGDYTSGGGQGYYGRIGEIFAYTSNLSAQNKSYIISNLALKWNADISSGVYGARITRDTGTTYSGNNTAKIVSATNDALTPFFETINIGDTGDYNLVCYAYTSGAEVTSSDVELYHNGSAITTTFTSMGSGWYKLNAVITGTVTNVKYGVEVKTNKTVYVTGFNLESQTPFMITSPFMKRGVRII